MMSHMLPRFSFFTLPRKIHTANVLCKQRDIALLRHRRKRKAPFHKERFIADTFVTETYDYPEPMPKYPPGNWGEMDSDASWKWHKLNEKLRTFPSLHDRLQYLYESEPNMWYHSIECPLNFPHIVDFAQFLTRTTINPSPPALPDSCPLSSADLTALSQELQAILSLQRPDVWSSVPDMMDCIHRWLIPHCEHLQDVHIDERGYLESFLKRSGYDELEKKDSPDYTVLDENRHVKFRIRTQTGWQMRATRPLVPFFPLDEVPTSDDAVPMYNYDPLMFDLRPVDCYGFKILPLHPTHHSREFLTNKAGYWPTSPFYEGDPCRFGCLATLHVPRPAFLSSLSFGPEITEQLITSHCLSEGILAGFVWTSAQAWNQGFSFYDDITFPFCSQLLLTDGRTFRVLAFQLNSLSALARGQNSDLPVNQVWMSEPFHLFERLEEGRAESWNEEALRRIVSCLSVAPMTSQAFSQLRPALQETPGPLMNLRDEPDFERPPPPRLFNQKRPHPNDMFFAKPTTRREVMEDIRKTFPKIGLLPEKYERIVEEFRRKQAFQKGRYKTLPPPLKDDV